MTKAEPKPEFLAQNLPAEVLASRDHQSARIRLYRQLVERTLARLEARALVFRVPRLRGLRRTGGPAFHATPELFFQQCGSTVFEMPEERFTVAAGELCLMPPGMPHAEMAQAARGPFLTLITMFWPDGLSLHFGHGSPGGKVISDPNDRFRLPNGLLSQCLDEIAAVLDESGAEAGEYVRALLMGSLLAIRRALERPYEKSPTSGHLVGRCQSLIGQHLNDSQLSVIWLADQLGCTPDHLSRAFRLKTGLSLIESINRSRIEYAVHLMEGNAFNVGEIAWASGYATQSYFNRLFRRQMGMTPLQYRASIAGAKRRPVGG